MSREQPGPHRGFVDARGFEHVTCVTCGGEAVWDTTVPADVVCVVPGHHIERDDDGRIVGDTCPLWSE